jgi:hypothetical protein
MPVRLEHHILIDDATLRLLTVDFETVVDLARLPSISGAIAPRMRRRDAFSSVRFLPPASSRPPFSPVRLHHSGHFTKIDSIRCLRSDGRRFFYRRDRRSAPKARVTPVCVMISVRASWTGILKAGRSGKRPTLSIIGLASSRLHHFVFPPSMTRKARRRSGAVSVGVGGTMASAASSNSPIDQT